MQQSKSLDGKKKRQEDALQMRLRLRGRNKSSPKPSSPKPLTRQDEVNKASLNVKLIRRDFDNVKN